MCACGILCVPFTIHTKTKTTTKSKETSFIFLISRGLRQARPKKKMTTHFTKHGMHVDQIKMGKKGFFLLSFQACQVRYKLSSSATRVFKVGRDRTRKNKIICWIVSILKCFPCHPEKGPRACRCRHTPLRLHPRDGCFLFAHSRPCGHRLGPVCGTSRRR